MVGVPEGGSARHEGYLPSDPLLTYGFRATREKGSVMRYTIGRIWTRRDEYLQLAARFIETSRAEDGCVYYDEGPMDGDPDGIVLVECWTTAAHHAAHTAAAHFKEFGPVFEKHVLKATFEEIDSEKINPIVIDFSAKS
jgi:quinol monooxygenase YgiN